MERESGTNEGSRPVVDHEARYTLTQRGWCEALGISSAAAEVLRVGTA